MNRKSYFILLVIVALGFAVVVYNTHFFNSNSKTANNGVAGAVALADIKQLQFNTGGAIRASDRYVFCVGNPDIKFDLKTGEPTNQVFGYDGITRAGNWTWHVKNQDSRQLFLRAGGNLPKANEGRAYDIPAKGLEGQFRLFTETVTVSPDRNRLELVMWKRYYRWNLKSGLLERNLELPIVPDSWGVQAPESFSALTRDGNSLIFVNSAFIQTISTDTARVTRKVSVIKSPDPAPFALSPSGSYSCHGSGDVVDTRTGRKLWTFQIEIREDPRLNRVAFSNDETRIAIPFPSRKIWEIRQLKTGKLLFQMPLLSGANSGSFSPDGATLYSIANGVLYRQRAR